MANQIVVSSGAKVRDLNDVIIGTSGVLSSLAFNVSNGVPKLDVNGKILVSQLPNSVMEYLGTWNAATNTPFLVNGTGNAGDVYLCNVAGTVDFGAGPITFVVSDQVIYSGSIWQKASGSNGTVTSVAVTESGDSLNITGSPITTSGTINIGFNGSNLQYINGAGDLTTFPTLLSSVGLSMPSAFNVSNSPLTANGTIGVTGAGVASQYIRGDGTLADFPTSGGGGSSVSYYLNGGTSQGVIGGITYYEMSKIAVIGTGVDFPKTGDGLIVSFLTDAGDPAQLNIPAGNWNYEIYASMSANGGTPELYAELYVYDGTTFTLIATSTNEILYDGTNLNLYTFAMAVPATTLAITDRLAVKLYATNSGGKTTTVHTQDGHLCQVITTFSTGITALNGLTAQVQYFATGTSGTDFAINSSTATHTFNLPVASASNTGKLSSTDWSTFNNKQATISLTTTGTSGAATLIGATLNIPNYGSALSGYLPLSGGTLTGPLNGTSANFSGKVTINSTLSAWMTAFSVLQMGTLTAFWNSDVNYSGIGNNIYYNGTFYKYLTTSFASKYEIGNGTFTWEGAPSGTAGDNVTFTEYMRLDSVGNLGLRTTTIGSRLQINGNAAIGYSASTAAPTNGLSVAGQVTFASALNGTSATFSGVTNITNATVSTSTTTGALLVTGGVGISGALFGTSASFSSTSTATAFIPSGSTVPTNGMYLSAANTLNFATNTTNRLTISSAGSVGIGTSSPSTLLTIGNTAGSTLSITTNGNAGTSASPLPTSINFVGYLGNINGQIKVEEISGSAQVSNMYFYTYFFGQRLVMSLTQTGNVVFQALVGTGSRAVLADANGQLSAPVSDISVKQNITTIGYGLNEILKMNPIWFDFIDEYKNYGEGRQNGNIAQEMAEIIPEAVFVTPSTNKMGINYDQLHAVYIKAIQEQQAQIKSLQEQINILAK
jgi:hypothetical protein